MEQDKPLFSDTTKAGDLRNISVLSKLNQELILGGRGCMQKRERGSKSLVPAPVRDAGV